MCVVLLAIRVSNRINERVRAGSSRMCIQTLSSGDTKRMANRVGRRLYKRECRKKEARGSKVQKNCAFIREDDARLVSPYSLLFTSVLASCPASRRVSTPASLSPDPSPPPGPPRVFPRGISARARLAEVYIIFSDALVSRNRKKGTTGGGNRDVAGKSNWS